MNYLLWDDRLTEADGPSLEKVNAAAARLEGLRAVQINVAGPFARSKIAWKLAVYQHALLHRLVALFDGAALAWNGRSILSAMLSVRALMETAATMAAFEDRASDLRGKEDLGGLDALAMRGIYASRDPEWLSEAPDTAAISVLTNIDKFDKRLPGFRRHYDFLSERCHPNALGHTFMFSKLDQSDGTVRFCEEQQTGQNAQIILAAISSVPLVESMMSRLDGLIVQVSDLHHRISPVGGSS